ncbi:MAG: hypothetical protein JO265_09445 [Acidimicrobiia bacterium]|nr:hypothetical protein [Acidimicrobiia bacterium]
MADSIEQQLTKVVNEAIARRDRALPRWASARAARLLRELEPGERRDVVERLCGRAELPEGIAADIQAAAERAGAPAPTPAAPRPTVEHAAPARSAPPVVPRPAPRTGRVQARTFRARTLADVPYGTLVEYLGRYGVVEPPWLVLDDGRRFQFLNPATVYVNGGVELDGWQVWKVADGRSMAECHDSGNWPAAE